MGFPDGPIIVCWPKAAVAQTNNDNIDSAIARIPIVAPLVTKSSKSKPAQYPALLSPWGNFLRTVDLLVLRSRLQFDYKVVRSMGKTFKRI